MNTKVFEKLKSLGIDAYLVYDFRGSNFIGRRVVGFETFTTRRWVALYTQSGEFHLVIPKLEESIFAQLDAQKHIYKTHEDFKNIIKELITPLQTVALEYSSNNDIPGGDIVPAGFVDLLKEVSPSTSFVSSANLTQSLAATWGKYAYESHQEASIHLKEILHLTLDYIKSHVYSDKIITDYDARMFIIDEYKKRNLYADEDICIVSTNERTGNPHYWPQEHDNYPIEKNSLLLIDIWAKLNQEGSVYSDSTFMAWIGPDPVPAKVQEVWDIVKHARDIGIDMVTNKINDGLQGYQVDREVRNYIISKGYGDYFVHRTGHSIDTNEHGNGANLDDFETYDTRLLLPDTGFSIEPGIYLPEFGIRSEVDMYIHPDGTPEVSTYKQDDLFIL